MYHQTKTSPPPLSAAPPPCNLVTLLRCQSNKHEPTKYIRYDFTACLAGAESQDHYPLPTSNATAAGCGPGPPQKDARTLFRRGWANKAVGDLDQAAADFEAARRLEPFHPHLSVDYRNIFDTELVEVDDVEPLTQAPALFHSW